MMLIIIVSMWKTEKKTRNKGWVSIVPIYNIICLSKDILGSGWYTLLLFLPIINIGITLVFFYKLEKKFNKNNLYCALLMFFPTVMWPLLAFDDTKYIEKNNDTISTNNNQSIYIG